jgi:hypothetical protein
MQASTSLFVSQQTHQCTTAQQRQRLVTMALGLAAGTPLAPKDYERMLLDEFVRGNLSIDQVLTRLERQKHE